MFSVKNASQVAIGSTQSNAVGRTADVISDLASEGSWHTAYGIFATEELGKKVFGKSKFVEIPGPDVINVCMAIESRKPQVILTSAKQAALRATGKVAATLKPQTSMPTENAEPSGLQSIAAKTKAKASAAWNVVTGKKAAEEKAAREAAEREAMERALQKAEKEATVKAAKNAYELSTVLRNRLRDLRTERRSMESKQNAKRLNANIAIMDKQAREAETGALELAENIHSKYGLLIGPLAKGRGNAVTATEGGKRKTRKQRRNAPKQTRKQHKH